MIVLWTVSVYLVNNKKKYFCTLFPAMFMTTVTVTYFIVAPECMGLLWSKINLSYDIFYPTGVILGIMTAIVFCMIFMHKFVNKNRKNEKTIAHS